MISIKIKELRKERHWSQAELAKRLGITRAAVNAWETEVSNPSIQLLIKLAEIFNVSTDYLLNIDKSEKINLHNLSKNDTHFIYELIDRLTNKN